MFKQIKNAVSGPSTTDAEFYAIAKREIEEGQMREGLWAKALTEAGFDHNKARTYYVQMAVKEIKAEYEEHKRQQELEREKERIKKKQEEARERALNEEIKPEMKKWAVRRFRDAEAKGSLDKVSDKCAVGLSALVEEDQSDVAIPLLAKLFFHGIYFQRDRDKAEDLLRDSADSLKAVVHVDRGRLYEEFDKDAAMDAYTMAWKLLGNDASSHVIRRKLRKIPLAMKCAK